MADLLYFPSIQKETSDIARSVVTQLLESKKYTHGKVGEWIETINSNCIGRLREISPNFKFIVNCFVMQSTGCGVHMESLTHWDPKTDGSVTIKYENESLVCICTVMGIAL